MGHKVTAVAHVYVEIIQIGMHCRREGTLNQKETGNGVDEDDYDDDGD